MPITMLDGILVFVMLVSAALAMIRGFTREVFSIGSWVAAAAVTYFFWEDVLPYAQRYIEDENIALGITVAGLFFVTLIVVSLITMRISDFVLDSRAGPLDRTLGFLFGAARGLILVVIAVMFLNFFIAPEHQPEWIATAKSKPWLDSLGADLMNSLPEDPEAEILERLRGEGGDQGGTPPGGEEPAEAPAAEAPAEDTPADGDADYATDDQNQLERQIEAPPPD
jgi:membrane protein required for colicin V production